MTTWYAQGWINGPTAPDRYDGVYGYDNGGFFGTIGASLLDRPFMVQWFGTPGGTVTDAILTVGAAPVTPGTVRVTIPNGIVLDLGQYGNVLPEGFSFWSVAGGSPFIQIETAYLRNPLPPWQTYLPGSRYTLTTTITPPWWGDGAFTLQDSNHSFSTDAFLTVYHMGPTAVPAPPLGAGLPGLVLALGALAWWLWRRYAPTARGSLDCVPPMKPV